MKTYKKFLYTTILIISLGCYYFIANSANITVTAVVGSLNNSPIIVSVNPNGDPKLLGKGKTQNYSIYFTDKEKDIVYYTITPQAGSANPVSGSIASTAYDTSSGAYINFTYLAPSVVPSPNPTTITVTLNDGPNLINKALRVNVY